MVEVRFACIPSVPGVKCTLDGEVQYSNDIGIASFFDVSQGEHTYSVESPEGWVFVSGEDGFGRNLPRSGTTIIEWVPDPSIPWPEANPWMMLLTFEEGEEPPITKAANTLGKAGAILAGLGFLGVIVDSVRRR